MNREQLRSGSRLLHVITDFHFQQQYSHAELTRLALDGGADMIQFRQKSGATRPFLQESERALHAFREWQRSASSSGGRVFIVNDRVEIALAIGADGVHIGQMDLPAVHVRKLIGPDRILGVTATTTAECRQAERDGADYIGFGPVFSTRSKSNPASVKGLAGLLDAVAAVSIPVIAIAGITPDRCQAVLDAGGAGVAVMSSIVLDPNPLQATRLFRQSLDR